MRILYLSLCLMAVTASPARTFKRNHPRKIEEKIEPVKEEKTEVLEIEDKTKESESSRAIFEQVNVVSSTIASSLEGSQDFTPHVVSLPPVNIGWPQPTTVTPNLKLKDEVKSASRSSDPENVYTVNIYINFNEDGLVYEEQGKADQRKKKPRPKPTTTTTEDYDYWYLDYVNLKDKPETPECPDGFKKMNGKCGQRRCQKGEALVGGTCVKVA